MSGYSICRELHLHAAFPAQNGPPDVWWSGQSQKPSRPAVLLPCRALVTEPEDTVATSQLCGLRKVPLSCIAHVIPFRQEGCWHSAQVGCLCLWVFAVLAHWGQPVAFLPTRALGLTLHIQPQTPQCQLFFVQLCATTLSGVPLLASWSH